MSLPVSRSTPSLFSFSLLSSSSALLLFTVRLVARGYRCLGGKLTWKCSYCQDYPKILELNAELRCTVKNRRRSVDTKHGICEMGMQVLLSA